MRNLRFLLLIPALAISGCASFQGRPYSVFAFEDNLKPVKEKYKPTEVIEEYYKKEKIYEKREYRDKVIALHMGAINSRYDQFLRYISMQNKGANSAADIAALGLSGAVPLFSGTATKDALAAGATFISGSQGKVNARVFYEATLPAIINVMETERTKILAEILKKKKADTNEKIISYDIAEALIDLNRYENSVSIDGAASILNQKAAAGLEDAKEKLEAADDPVEAESQEAEAAQTDEPPTDEADISES